MRNIQDYDSIGLWDDRMTIFYILLFSSAGIGLPPFALIAIVFIIVSPFLSANIRVFDETTKFWEEFLLLALISPD